MIPRRDIHLQKWPFLNNRRAIDQYIDTPISSLDLLEERVHILFTCDISLHSQGLPSQARNLGAYFASLAPPKAPEDDNPDLSKKGSQAAVGRRCASCHTDSYAGTKAVARVAGQRQEYLLKALHDYKSSVRSGGGQAAMADVAYPLSEEEIEALAHYLAHL